ncbi:hypothetical protein HPP92_006842 [Vanilla planifolia]|uniref:Inhibitor I9 domain-containing protein n=1 Tax=Vanilla planifolia TaxID=51239 RepID=A0A835R925_VANPL|nr:hypothetical protein HPP92_006842 [Vanilla planifolia]
MASQTEEKLPDPTTDTEERDGESRALLVDEAPEDGDEQETVEVPSPDTESGTETAAVHIVHLIRPEGEDPEAFDIRTLASVLGSDEAAKEAVVYHYTLAASGFSARLTSKQVGHLSAKPEVLVVVPDRICTLR